MKLLSTLVMLIVLLVIIELPVEANGEKLNSVLSDVCMNKKLNLDLARRRRHLTFPNESAMILTLSLLKAFMTHAPSGWNLVLEVDVIYPLPDEEFTNKNFRRKIHHRQQREFWEKLEAAVEIHNINGHACVLRSVCEANTYLAPPGKSLVYDILRAVFTVPPNDEEFREEIRDSYSELLDPKFCDKVNDCPFSFFDFILALNKEY